MFFVWRERRCFGDCYSSLKSRIGINGPDMNLVMFNVGQNNGKAHHKWEKRKKRNDSVLFVWRERRRRVLFKERERERVTSWFPAQGFIFIFSSREAELSAKGKRSNFARSKMVDFEVSLSLSLWLYFSKISNLQLVSRVVASAVYGIRAGLG